MGEYDFTDNLVALTSFRDSHEAAPVCAQLEARGIEVHLEDAASSHGSEAVELLVRQGDLRQARHVLADLQSAEQAVDDYDPDDGDPDDGDPDDYDADDWSGEDWADDDDEYEEYSEEPAQTPPLTRAWRAALIGGLLLPCLVLNVYSVWLILQHKLWRPQPGERHVNWRLPAALFFNLFGLFFFWMIVSRLNLSRLYFG